VTAGWPGQSEEPRRESALGRRDAWVPLGCLDPAIIDRARAINADVLKAIEDLLDRDGDSGRG
jgi:hypothetical protein